MDDRKTPIARWSWAVILAATVAKDAAAQSPEPPAPPRPARRCAPGAAVCTGCSTTRPTRSRTTSSAIPRPSSSRRWARTSTGNSPFRSRRPTRIGSRSIRRDFLPGTDRFSPIGASRFNLMYSRLAGWPGPIFVEWTPDQPELAESRRRAILATLASAGQPMPAERVVIGPSPYPGAMGVDADNNIINTIGRNQFGSKAFPPPPAFTASMGVR